MTPTNPLDTEPQCECDPYGVLPNPGCPIHAEDGKDLFPGGWVD